MFSSFINQGHVYYRPSRLLSKKGEQYHIDCANHYLSAMNWGLHDAFVYKCLVNDAFIQGEQWILENELDSFFMDDSGESLNRIRYVNNIVRPMIEYYRGNTIRMDFSVEAEAISSEAINRRELELTKLLVIQSMIESNPESPISQFLMQTYLVGNSEEETRRLFRTKYTDKYAEYVTNICTQISKENDFDLLKHVIGEDVYAYGVGVAYEEEWASTQTFRKIDPKSMIFDYSSLMPNFSDAGFMGHWEYLNVSEIIELHPDLTKKQIEHIESIGQYYASSNNYSFLSSGGSGKIPVCVLYWTDSDREEYGLVLDNFGYPCLKKLNHKYPDGTVYTDASLIENSLDLFPSVLRGKNKSVVFPDSTRYIKFIPNSIAGHRFNNSTPDVVLKYGELEYTSNYGLQRRNAIFPYSLFCWSYRNGVISSPIDDMIDPQRLLNRVISVSEARFSNTQGDFTIVDKRMFEDEEEAAAKMKKGDVIFADRGNELNNSVYQNRQDPSKFAILFNVAETIKKFTGEIIGGGVALTGGGGAYRATGSVYDAQLSQGQLMQEPIFFCINRILYGCYDLIVKRGFKIYLRNPQKLISMLGEDAFAMLSQVDDLANEDFRVFIKRVASKDEQDAQKKAELFELFVNQLVDGQDFAAIYNNPNKNNIKEALINKQLAIIHQSKLAEQQAQTAQAQQAQQGRDMMELQALEGDKQHLRDKEIQMMKDNANMDRTLASKL